MNEKQSRNEYLIYTIESIIDKGNQKRLKLTPLPLYKFLYLAYQKLKSLGINIELPYSWYIHGTMVESIGFSYHTGGLNLQEYLNWGGSAVNAYSLSSTLSINNSEKFLIDNTVDALLEQYSSNNWIDFEHLLKDVYAYAPYDFQREFKFSLLKRNPNTLSRSEIRKTLDSLKSSFPREKYASVYSHYLRWDDTIRLAITLDIPNQEIIGLYNIFWRYFTSAIRLKENENLTSPEIKQAANIEHRKEEILNIALDEAREKYLIQFDDSKGNDISNTSSTLLNELNRVAYSTFISER